MHIPNPDSKYPLENYNRLCFLKNIIKNPNIIVGDFTYYDDFENVENFEKNVKYHFEFIGDRLIIGKFCMIASDVTFIMNGANHLSKSITSYPFSIFGGDWLKAMDGKEYPSKGDTIVGNDVWIGYSSTIMPGVRIGDGAIVAAHSMVTKDVEPYAIVGGNPSREIRKRFSPSEVKRLLEIKWWDWPVEKITEHLQTLTSLNIQELNRDEGRTT